MSNTVGHKEGEISVQDYGKGDLGMGVAEVLLLRNPTTDLPF